MKFRSVIKCVLQTLQIVSIFLLIPAFVSALLSTVFSRLYGNDPSVLGFFEIINRTIGYICAILLLIKINRKTMGDLPQATKFKHKEMHIKWVLMCAVAGMGCNLFMSTLLTLAKPLALSYFEKYDKFAKGSLVSGYIPMNILWILIVAPIAEELVFRGYIMNRLRMDAKTWIAMSISSMVFGAVHLNPIWITYAFIFGMILSWVAVKYDNIAYSMIFHVGFNFMAIPLTFIKEGTELYERLFGSTLNIVINGIVGGVLALTALIIIKNNKAKC